MYSLDVVVAFDRVSKRGIPLVEVSISLSWVIYVPDWISDFNCIVLLRISSSCRISDLSSDDLLIVVRLLILVISCFVFISQNTITTTIESNTTRYNDLLAGLLETEIMVCCCFGWFRCRFDLSSFGGGVTPSIGINALTIPRVDFSTNSCATQCIRHKGRRMIDKTSKLKYSIGILVY